MALCHFQRQKQNFEATCLQFIMSKSVSLAWHWKQYFRRGNSRIPHLRNIVDKLAFKVSKEHTCHWKFRYEETKEKMEFTSDYPSRCRICSAPPMQNKKLPTENNWQCVFLNVSGSSLLCKTWKYAISLPWQLIPKNSLNIWRYSPADTPFKVS